MNYYKIFTCYFFLFFQFFSEFVYSAPTVKVVGNKFVPTELIIGIVKKNFSGSDLNLEIDLILKELYSLRKFDNILVNLNGSEIVIEVKERPIIKKIVYEGLSSGDKKILKDNDVIKINDGDILNNEEVFKTQAIIKQFLRDLGFLASSVTPKIINEKDGFVNLVFEIKKGGRTYIKKINFVGNKSFRSSDLESVILTKVKKFYHLPFGPFIQDKVFNEQRFFEDKKNLVDFYVNRGYADFVIKSGMAEYDKRRNLYIITYHVDEGERYSLRSVSFKSEIKDLDSKKLKSLNILKIGEIFSDAAIKTSLKFIENYLSILGYDFVKVDYKINRNLNSKTIDLEFIVSEGKKFYIRRINIKKNYHSCDEFVRRYLDFCEGDKFIQNKLKYSEDNLKRSGFFEKIKIKPNEVPESEDEVDVDVVVSEKRAGEVKGTLSFNGIDYFTGGLKLSQPNSFGRGICTDLGFNFSSKFNDGSFSLTDSSFLNRRMSAGFSIFFNNNRRIPYEIRNTFGGKLRFGYVLRDHLSEYWSYSLSRENFKFNENYEKTDASVITIKESLEEISKRRNVKFNILEDWKEYGKYISSSIGHTLMYDTRDVPTFPSRGGYMDWGITFSGLGGNVFYLRNIFGFGYNFNLFGGCVLAFHGNFTVLTPVLNKDLRSSENVRHGLPGFRGFDIEGISPRRSLQLSAINNLRENWENCDNYNEDKEILEKYKKNREDLNNELKNILSEFKDYNLKSTNAPQHEEKSRTDLHSYEVSLKKLNEKLKVSDGILKEMSEEYRDFLTASKNIGILTKVNNDLGGKYSWIGSIDLRFPIPIFPQDFEIYGNLFTDVGSVWNSGKTFGDSESVVFDEHLIRMSVGFGIGMNIPMIGFINFGYAWPIVKEKGDHLQEFIFMYSFKYD